MQHFGFLTPASRKLNPLPSLARPDRGPPAFIQVFDRLVLEVHKALGQNRPAGFVVNLVPPRRVDAPSERKVLPDPHLIIVVRRAAQLTRALRRATPIDENRRR